jgi:hypothetical protein
MKRIEDESKARINKRFIVEQVQRQRETPQIGRLLLLYVDDAVADATPFGDVRKLAFKIIPKDALQTVGQRLSEKLASKLAMHWHTVDGLAAAVTCARYTRCSISLALHRRTRGSRHSPG